MFDPFVEGWVVFSAHAEVVPRLWDLPASVSCILRARGGSSMLSDDEVENCAYSPRTRR